MILIKEGSTIKVLQVKLETEYEQLVSECESYHVQITEIVD